MTGPIGFAFRLVDGVLGLALMMTLIVGALGAFILGGAPKKYEIDALGGAYTSALETVEGAARDLREGYCAQPTTPPAAKRGAKQRANWEVAH